MTKSPNTEDGRSAEVDATVLRKIGGKSVRSELLAVPRRKSLEARGLIEASPDGRFVRVTGAGFALVAAHPVKPSRKARWNACNGGRIM